MTGESVWSDGGHDRTVTQTSSSKFDEKLLPLFERLASGNLDALGEIYDLCARQIYGLVLWKTGSEADAADAMQDVFIRLADYASKLGSVRHPFSYLMQIAHRIAHDIFRKRRREAQQMADLVVPLFEGYKDPGYVSSLGQYLRQLPSEQRTALYLHFFMGLTMREVAKVTGVTGFTAASRCRIGLEKLRKRFGEERT